LIGFQRFLGF
jgi:hypothetical protein